MRILFGHIVHSPGVAEWYRAIAGAAGDGLEVRPFCVTLDPPGPRLSWAELDARWKRKDRALMDMYARLGEAAASCDVFLLYNGANVHPEFVSRLPTFNVFCCFDDPESSADLSAPAAAAFDAVFHGNIASRFQYEALGCRRLAWLPIFTSPGDVPCREEGERLLAAERSVDIVLVCDNNGYRRSRLETLSRAFPGARCFGRGWETGRIDEQAVRDLYGRARIGWNVHNSTGPINRRLFALPAHAVLQICDNKTGLGMIFDLGREAVGFDTIPEAVDLTRHYLAHEAERRSIAANGWRRYWADYHAAAIWRRIAKQLAEWMPERGRKETAEVLSPTPRAGDDAASPPGLLARLPRAAARRVRAAGRELLRLPEPASPPPPPAAPRSVDERLSLGERIPAYAENPGLPGVNMARERLSRGEPFEWPNMLALNWAATSLIRDARSIVEIGSGTGPFAAFASVVPGRTLHCFEADDHARTWAETHRGRPDVSYFKSYDGNLRDTYDLLVSIDVVEHVADLRAFLLFCAGLAPRAIFSTPNRDVLRGGGTVGPPDYPAHVREFDPGEFYWTMKQYYADVALYHTPDVNVPWLEPMTIASKGTPIVAECTGPLDAAAPPGAGR